VPGIVRDALAAALDMPGHCIRVIAPDGRRRFGGQGLALSGGNLRLCRGAGCCGARSNGPSDRLEDLAANSQGFDEIIDAELALDNDGRIVALRADVIGDVGAYSIYSVDRGARAGAGREFFARPLSRATLSAAGCRRWRHRKRRPEPYRGVGRPDFDLRHGTADGYGRRQSSALDAKESGCASHCRRRAPYKVASGIVWDKSGFHECLHAACAAIGYAHCAPNKGSAAAGAGSALDCLLPN